MPECCRKADRENRLRLNPMEYHGAFYYCPDCYRDVDTLGPGAWP